MEIISYGDDAICRPGAARHRGQLNHAVREALRDLSVQMSLVTHRIGGHLDLKGTDLECLDLIAVTARSARAHSHDAPGSTQPP